MRVDEFDYSLPSELVAQEPPVRRSASRLLVLDRLERHWAHLSFIDILHLVRPGDCLVLNDTRVMPARLKGRRSTGGSVELLLLRKRDRGIWEVLAKPARKARVGERLLFGEELPAAEVLAEMEDGRRLVHFDSPTGAAVLLEKAGLVPLPPYIHREIREPERYQTVYARVEGSAAAPTAGFHFTEGILALLREGGIKIAYLTLHIGLGTFRPVKTERVEDHSLHREWFDIPAETAELVNETRAGAGRVIGVGTTVARTLESVADERGRIRAGSGDTDLFIFPGFRFRVIDAMLTNFHLPRSTLLMLVCAFAGRDLVLAAYEEAIRKHYRFYSFGDAMLVL